LGDISFVEIPPAVIIASLNVLANLKKQESLLMATSSEKYSQAFFYHVHLNL